GYPVAGGDRRTSGSGSGVVRARRTRCDRGARGRAVGHLHAAAEALPGPARPRGGGGARQMTTGEQAYGEVERVTRERARNFSYGIRLLPKAKRRAIAAIYAFAREVDDIADDPSLPAAERRVRLEALRASLANDPGDSPMLVALADARARY